MRLPHDSMVGTLAAGLCLTLVLFLLARELVRTGI